MPRFSLILAVSALCLVAAPRADAAEDFYTVKMMTLELAQKAANAALSACRAGGFQVAVAVLDRGGNLQVLLRDRYAGPHTPSTAKGKAWTAISFRTDTSDLAEATKAGSPQSGVRAVPGALMLGGGVLIQSAGATVGGIGVSGAPSGQQDDMCADAGIEAISEALDF